MSAPTPARALPEGPVILDASFVIALLEGEDAAARHAGVLARSVISSITLGEVYAKLHQRAGIEPATIEDALRALGARLVDFLVTAAAHFPALRAIDAARRAQQKADGEKAATLCLADLAVLAHAMAAGLPVLTGDRHWATLAPTAWPSTSTSSALDPGERAGEPRPRETAVTRAQGAMIEASRVQLPVVGGADGGGCGGPGVGGLGGPLAVEEG